MILPELNIEPIKPQSIGFTGLYGNVERCENTRCRGNEAVAACDFSRTIELSSPRAVFAHDGIYAIDGDGLYKDGERIATVGEGAKSVAKVCGKLCIAPDGLYVDAENLEMGTLAASFESSAGGASFAGHKITFSGSPPLGDVVSNPARLHDGETELLPIVYTYTQVRFEEGEWITEGGAETPVTADALAGRIVLPYKNLVGTYSVQINYATDPGRSWRAVNTDGVYGVGLVPVPEGEDRIAARATLYTSGGAGSLKPLFAPGDRVNIAGAGENDRQNAVVTAVSDSSIEFSTDFTTAIPAGKVTLSRGIPAFDLLCGHLGRLWAAKGRRLYATRRGDVRSLEFETELSSDGDITALRVYNGVLVVFKERSLIRILDDAPDIRVFESPATGVPKGSERTLAAVGASLIYAGRDGFYEYTGTTPDRLCGFYKGKKPTCAAGRGGEYCFSLDSGVYALELDGSFERGTPVLEGAFADAAANEWKGARLYKISPIAAADMTANDDGLILAAPGGIYTEQDRPAEHFRVDLKPFAGIRSAEVHLSVPRNGSVQLVVKRRKLRMEEGQRRAGGRAGRTETVITGPFRGTQSIAAMGGYLTSVSLRVINPAGISSLGTRLLSFSITK